MQVSAVFERNDKDGDGKLSREEFKVMMMREKNQQSKSNAGEKKKDKEKEKKTWKQNIGPIFLEAMSATLCFYLNVSCKELSSVQLLLCICLSKKKNNNSVGVYHFHLLEHIVLILEWLGKSHTLNNCQIWFTAYLLVFFTAFFYGSIFMESILNFWHDWEKKQAQMLHFVHFLQSLPFKHSCTFKKRRISNCS